MNHPAKTPPDSLVGATTKRKGGEVPRELRTRLRMCLSKPNGETGWGLVELAAIQANAKNLMSVQWTAGYFRGRPALRVPIEPTAATSAEAGRFAALLNFHLWIDAKAAVPAIVFSEARP